MANAAQMIKGETSRNWADEPFVGNSVDKNRREVFVVKLAVSGSANGAAPKPAAVGKKNLRPKSLSERIIILHREITPFGAMQSGAYTSRLPSILGGGSN